MRFLISVIFLHLFVVGSAQCPAGQIEDCNGNCQPADWVGDGVCDDGYNFPSDFMCEEFDWDAGDCGCPDGEIQDCNGNCFSMSLIGDGTCHDSESIDFSCEVFDWDGGDCPAECPDGQIADCNGNCQPIEWIGDGVCDNGIDVPSDFLCEEFNWDEGDCGCFEDCIEDCNGNLYSESMIGDGICNDGVYTSADFLCAEHNWDNGDCNTEECDPGFITDCLGNCAEITLIGDGTCHDDDAINFACAEFDWDGGDCEIVCPEGQFADCDGNCWDNYVLQYLNNWHCSNTLWLGWLFDPGEVGVNFDCEQFDFDGGDCLVWGCTDPDAINYYEHADNDDGTCFYGDCPPGTMDCMGNCIPDNWLGTNECPDGISEEPQDHLFDGAYPNTLLGNIPLPGAAPKGLCVLPDGSRAYLGTANGFVMVGLTEEGCEPSTLIPTTGMIYSCCASIDSEYVFGANWNGFVEVLETATNTIVETIPVGVNPLKMRTSNDGQRIYCSNHGAASVSVIDANTFEVITTIPVGIMPRNIALSPDDSRLYVSNWYSWTMSVINTTTWETITEVPIDFWPQAVWALPNDDYVLLANFGWDLTYDHISVIRVSDWEVIARLQTGAGPEDMVSIGPNGEYLYVSNWGMQCCFLTSYDYCCSAEVNKGSVTVIATPDFDAIVPPDEVPDEIPYINATVTTIPLDAEYSFGMDRHPDGNAIYVANMQSSSMSIIGFEDDIPDENLEGDNCENAIQILSPNFSLSNCTLGYSDDYNEACPFPEIGAPDVVYRYDAQYTQTANIDLCSSSYDTKIYIYEGACGTYNSGTAIYCSDDFCGLDGFRSRLDDVTFEAGSTYFIVVDGYNAASKGHFILDFENECPGDFNGDAVITVSDLLFFLTGYGNQFDSADLLQFLAWFGNECD
jgi:YVTN family beta-propeller protein